MKKNKLQPITQFEGPYQFLSNFFIEPDGTHVEGEYQRAKCALAHERVRFHVLKCELCESENRFSPCTDGNHYSHRMTEIGARFKPPDQCKAIGAKVQMRPDWEDVKIDIMTFYVRRKFAQAELQKALFLTGGKPLIHENWGQDKFWGTYRGEGLNFLGAILMDTRDYWREEQRKKDDEIPF